MSPHPPPPSISPLLLSLSHATHLSNALPPALPPPLPLIHPPLARSLSHLSTRLLSLLSALPHTPDLPLSPSDDSLSDVDDLGPAAVASSATVIVDDALERFYKALDAARGVVDAPPPPPRGALAPAPSRKNSTKGHLQALDIGKPQHERAWHVDNSDVDFVPPCGVPTWGGKQGGEVIGEGGAEGVAQRHLRALARQNGAAQEGMHPYEQQIQEAVERWGVADIGGVTLFGALHTTQVQFVQTKEELQEVARCVRESGEMAVDVENHSVRSFQGFCCLVQISTRERDFVVDVLELRDVFGEVMGGVFRDGAVVKVMHGAERDVVWLERDFGVYVVGLFDTGQAARVLKMPKVGLAYLLQMYCGVEVGEMKKRWQLADWRVRPIPADMFAYARADTHYLLYIYDRVRQELGAKGRREVWKRSGEVARRRYRKMRWREGEGKTLAARYGLGLSSREIVLLEELLRWRDRTARKKDESLAYVAPLNVLVAIVRGGALRSVDKLVEVGGGGKVPPLVRECGHKLVRLVENVRNAPMEDVEGGKEAEGEILHGPECDSDGDSDNHSDKGGDVVNAPHVAKVGARAIRGDGVQREVRDDVEAAAATGAGVSEVSARATSALFEEESSSDSGDDEVEEERAMRRAREIASAMERRDPTVEPGGSVEKGVGDCGDTVDGVEWGAGRVVATKGAEGGDGQVSGQDLSALSELHSSGADGGIEEEGESGLNARIAADVGVPHARRCISRKDRGVCKGGEQGSDGSKKQLGREGVGSVGKTCARRPDGGACARPGVHLGSDGENREGHGAGNAGREKTRRGRSPSEGIAAARPVGFESPRRTAISQDDSCVRVIEAAKSVFNLSDDSESGESGAEGEDRVRDMVRNSEESMAQIVERVRAGMEVVDGNAPKTFAVETDVQQQLDESMGRGVADSDWARPSSKRRRAAVEEENEDTQPISLLEAYGRNRVGKSKKRKAAKKETPPTNAGTVHNLAPFDYAKAFAESSLVSRRADAFDPLRKLTVREKGGVRAKKKRPRNGAKSMSFRGR